MSNFNNRSKLRLSEPQLRLHTLKHSIREAIEATNKGRAISWKGGLAATVLFGLTTPAISQVISLSDLDGSNGFKINGENVNYATGGSVSNAGDVNGDGIDDVIIGARLADQNGNNSGASYVVFGQETGFSSLMDLGDLNGINGFKIVGEARNDSAGISVSGVGDFNGDGIDDVIVGAYGANPNDDSSGASYVVFGNDGGFNTTLELADLNGSDGFKINGEARRDRSGRSVSGAGDVNGDGLSDIIVGAASAGLNYGNTGASYVLFGSANGFSTPLELSSLDGNDGFKIIGESPHYHMGSSVSGAGDVNGDGIDDIVIGAETAYVAGYASGVTYIVFGRTAGFGSTLELASLDGTNGFRLNGEMLMDYSGSSVSAAGDINGDGIDDVIVGAHWADPNGSYSGASYVVFGHSNGFNTPMELSDLNGVNGFKINGATMGGRAGGSVSAAGDVNGDGVDDFIIGARFDNSNGLSTGAAYVVFGRESGFSTPLELTALDGINGFRLEGEADYDSAGSSVSAAGDINGDGLDDLLVGASQADSNGFSSGASYVVFGSPSIGQSTTSRLVSCVGDVEGDEGQDISVLVHDLFAGTLTAFVKDGLSGDPISQIEFDGMLTPVDMQIMSDINGNGAPELVVTGNASAVTRIRDSLSGELLGSVDFNTNAPAFDLELVPDQDGNGVPELAHLGGGSLNVEVIDPLSANAANPVAFFNRNLKSRDLSVIDRSGDPELAVLGEHNKANQPDKIQIRKLSDGSMVRKIFLGKGWQVKQMELLSDLNSNGSVEAAVLRVITEDDLVSVLIKDTRTREKINYLGFDAEFPPIKMAIIPSTGNNNESEEIAVLGRRAEDARQKVTVKDGLSRELISQVFFPPKFVAQDVTVCPDMNGNGVSELVVLGKRSSDGKIRVFIKDAVSGELISKVNF